MTKTLEGQIVSSQVGNYGNTDVKYGFITIQTNDDSHVRLKVDSSTTYDTLEMGHDVIVSAKQLGSTKLLVAREVRKK
ncbi:MAG: hypothetical protein RTU30_08115 [Candidatus Thorarchaeota archaeon]